jgi:uncharacterized repeat protein (TIGR01451 family)/MYXO-CTERM domain-containing protein
MSGLAIAASCGNQSTPAPTAVANPPASEVSQYTAALAGQDGAFTVPLANTQVNSYAVVAADIKPGDKTLQVTALPLLPTPIVKGDLLMIMQMQGASLDFTDTINYGTVINYNGAGRYEFVTVTDVNLVTKTISVLACKGGIRNAYSAAAHTQVVRVPQYTTLTVPKGTSIVAPAWDGSKGGIVAVSAQTSVTLNGNIDVSGLGFRPGLLDNQTSTPGAGPYVVYRNPDPALGGEKGEGIGGYSADYDASGGRYGRGAPGNGGGGGNAHNAGGGGGANASNGVAWRRGQGIMDPNTKGAAAWALDPEYALNGNKLTTDGGGGRGGYTYGATDQDALTVGPGKTAWGGDDRNEVGGLGGRPLDPGVTQRLFFGGGGGAGDGNNMANGQGGAGGGLVFLASPTISGNGGIIASGTDGAPTMGANNDAPGGGGGGGTIVVAAQTLSGITATANGGAGGNQGPIVNESEGPGGGGGGGFIAVTGGAIATSVAAGKSGTSQSTAVTEFPVNGATDGNSGNDKVSAAPLVALIPQLDCSATMADLAVSITDNLNGAAPTPGGQVIYTDTFQNLSTTTPVKAASISDTIPPNIPPQSISWTCTPMGAAVCPAASGTGSVPPIQVDLPAASGLVYKVTVPVPANASGQFNYSAAIQAPIDINDPNPANNTATDSAKLPAPDLAVYVSDNLQGKNAQPGSPIVYTVTVANNGTLATTGASLTDSLPAGVNIASWTCTATGKATCPAASGTGSISSTMINLGPGDTLTYVATTNNIPNTATSVSYRLVVAPPAGQTDSDPSNNSAVDTHAVDTSLAPATNSDLALTISHTPQKLLPGQDVTYTAQVTNNGPQAVTNAVVNFTVPAGSIIKTGASGTGWTCTQAGVQASCTALTLPMGAAPPITVVITDPTNAVPGGTPVAQGSVSASRNTDPNPANNTATDAGTLPQADLALTIARSPQTPQPGDTVTYTLNVSNAGPDTATSPTVVFTVPAGGTVTMPAAGTGWTCTQKADTFTCVGADLPQGAAPPITVQVQLPAASGNGTPPLVGQVGSPGVGDPNLANNRAVSDLPTSPETHTDLGVTLTRSPQTSQPGQVVTYTAQVTNYGTDTVYGPTVTFQLPPGGIVVQPAQGMGWVCGQSGDTVTCERSSLAVGPAPPITVQLTTPLDPTGNPSANTGTVSASVSATRNVDPNPANDYAVVGAGNLPPSNSDLAVTITRDPQMPNPGDQETITVQVTNKGTDPATGVAVSVQIPPDTQVVQPAQGTGWNCVPNGQVYLCTRNRLDVGPAPPITLIVVTPNPTTNGDVPTATTSVSAASTPTDPNPADNTASTPIGTAGNAGPDGGTGGSINKLAGGGFSCQVDPSSPAWPGVQLAFGALVAALLRRRRR